MTERDDIRPLLDQLIDAVLAAERQRIVALVRTMQEISGRQFAWDEIATAIYASAPDGSPLAEEAAQRPAEEKRDRHAGKQDAAQPDK